MFDYGYKVTTFFLIYKFFLTFFILFFRVRENTYIYICRLSCVPLVSLVFRVRCCAVSGGVLVVVVCPDGYLSQSYARARGFLDSNF